MPAVFGEGDAPSNETLAFAMRRRGMTLRDLYRSLSREFLA